MVKEAQDTPKPTGQVSMKDLRYVQYSPDREEQFVDAIRSLIGDQLSEPYSIYVYRYFLYQWPDLCFMALDQTDSLIGVVVSKLEPHRGGPMRGYIAMLAVQGAWRGQGIATKLVRFALDTMIAKDAEEIVLEAETTNLAAMKLYERLGFLRSKRLHRYYLNGNTAYRFALYVKGAPQVPDCAPLADGAAVDASAQVNPPDARNVSGAVQSTEPANLQTEPVTAQSTAPQKKASGKSKNKKSKAKGKGKG